jgi:hypothetical protein
VKQHTLRITQALDDQVVKVLGLLADATPETGSWLEGERPTRALVLREAVRRGLRSIERDARRGR